MKNISKNLKLTVLLLFALIGISLFSTGSVHAATKTWAGTAPSDVWSNDDNWSPSGAPVNGDSVVFDCADSNHCKSVYDIPTDLSLISVTFSGAVAGEVLNDSTATLTLTGDIDSTNPGTIFDTPLVLGDDITINNTVITLLDLNGHTVTFTGKGILDTETNLRSMGVGSDLTGDGTINIDVDSDQEFYLAGENTYTGTTNVNSGRFVSNGQNPNNRTLDMFGDSDVNVGPMGKIVFTVNETEDGLEFENNLSFTRTNPDYSQMEVINETTDDSLVTVNFSAITLQSDTRFDVDTTEGGITVNLAGITANNHCIEYGSDNSQSSNFTNGPDCTEEEVPISEESEVPGAPETGSRPSSIAPFIIAATVVAGIVIIHKRRTNRTRA